MDLRKPISTENIPRDGGHYFSKVTSYILLITLSTVTHHNYLHISSNISHTFSQAYCKSHLFII